MNALKGSRKTRIFAAAALVSASALVIAGCSSTPSGDTSDGGEKPAADLTLKLGSLLPQTGSLAFLGPPMESGVGLAVEDMGVPADEHYTMTERDILEGNEDLIEFCARLLTAI